jgi:hypothetical protein
MAQARDVKLSLDMSNLYESPLNDFAGLVKEATDGTVKDYILSMTRSVGEWDQKGNTMSILIIWKGSKIDVKTDVSKIPAESFDALPGRWLVYRVELDCDKNPLILMVHENHLGVDTKTHFKTWLSNNPGHFTLVDPSRLPSPKELRETLSGMNVVKSNYITLCADGATVKRVLNDKQSWSL